MYHWEPDPLILEMDPIKNTKISQESNTDPKFCKESDVDVGYLQGIPVTMIIWWQPAILPFKTLFCVIVMLTIDEIISDKSECNQQNDYFVERYGHAKIDWFFSFISQLPLI